MKTSLPRRFFLAAALATIFCQAIPASAQVLLSTAEFSLLGGTAITVGGAGPNAIVNGHVGLSPAATTNITGFPPAVVSGNTQSGTAAAIIATGGTTSQARLDLITAQNALAAMPSNSNVSNVDLGGMAALFSGVYTFNGAATQTGALVLDAQGQNGVAWVFQIGTSLTTSVNSTVTFINLGSNGGNDLGLFWNAGTAITIGDNNTILGNYLAGTSISFTGSTALLGNGGARALSLAGISFAGPATLNALGGPGGGDYDGGLMYNGLGQLVPIPVGVIVPPVVIPPVTPGVVVPPVVPVVPPVVVYTGNVLLSAPGAFTPGPSGVTLVPGTPYPASTLTIDGVSADGSAPASLTVNTAIVTLTGANTYTAGTVVNGGTLIAAAANLPANRPIALNDSTLNLTQAADGTFGGVISGNGSVIKLGASTLTLSGANTYTGGTVVNAGTLVASTASLPVDKGVVIASGSALVFNQAADGTFGGTIAGNGTIRKTGTGALTLANTTTSAVNIQAGRFYSNATVGWTTVEVGALLGGNVTIAGDLVNHGTVSPGNSPGTTSVTGNYTQSAAGTLLVEIASATSFDRLVVTGAANLAGTVRVETLGGYNPLGQSFTFLTATGGVNGTFGSFTHNLSGSAATTAQVTYAPTSATVSFRQLPFTGFAETPNQTAVANAGQNVVPVTDALNDVPQAGQFPGALNALSPQGYAVWSEAAFAQGTALTDRLARFDGNVPGRDEFYFDVSERRTRMQGDADVGETTFTNSFGLVGGNTAFTPNFTFGGFFSFGRMTASLGTPGSSTTAKDKMPGLRAVWSRPDGWYTEAVLAYGFDDYESTRVIAFPGTNATATSTTKGHQWLGGFTAGKHITHGAVTFSPFGGLLANRWEANGFTETGAGAFNLTVGDQSARSLRSQLGAEIRLNRGFLQPHLRAAWLHEFANDARGLDAAFGGVNYTVVTREPQRDSGLFTAGLDFVFGPRALLYVDVTAQTGGRVKLLSAWRAGLSVSF